MAIYSQKKLLVLLLCKFIVVGIEFSALLPSRGNNFKF